MTVRHLADYMRNISPKATNSATAVIAPAAQMSFLLNHIRKSRISVIIAHGEQTNLLTSHDILDDSEIETYTHDSLANVDLIIYGACLTGSSEGGIQNLVTTTYNEQAKIVIGFPIRVRNDEVILWCEKLFEELKNGETIDAASALANREVENTFKNRIDQYGYISTQDPTILGDKTTRFKFD